MENWVSVLLQFAVSKTQSDPSHQKLAELLEYIRQCLGSVGDTELAEFLEVEYQTLRRWLLRSQGIGRTNKRKIARRIGCNPKAFDSYLQGEASATDFFESLMIRSASPPASEQPTRAQVALANILQELNELGVAEVYQLQRRVRETWDLMVAALLPEVAASTFPFRDRLLWKRLEAYRLESSLSEQQLIQQLSCLGRIAQARAACIVRGEILPNDEELLGLGAILKKADGGFYDDGELESLREQTAEKFEVINNHEQKQENGDECRLG